MTLTAPDLALGAQRAEWVRAAWARLSSDRLRELAVGMTGIPSPTGDEGPLAAYLAGELAGAGLEAEVLALDERQANARGRRRGDGSGASLLLYAPIDTLTVGTAEEDLPWVGPELRPDMVPEARIEGPYVSGLGASNPKGHGACVLAAAEAVAAAGIPLAGDLLVGFGAGGMPTNARGTGGRRNTGQGAGCSFLLEQGTFPDCAVLAKPGWTVSWEEVGLAWFEVRVHGTHTYVGSRHRLPYRNPIADAATVVRELEAWFPAYAERHADGLVAPQGIVGAIEGGWWRMAAVTPATARLLVDLRLSPRTTPPQAGRELAEALDGIRSRHGVELDWRLVLAIPGESTPEDAFVTRAAIAAWEELEGRPHEVVREMSGATDANILRARGIPTVRVGMPKVADTSFPVDFARGMNTVDVREMERLARLLVHVAVNTCTRPLEEVLR